MVLLGQGSAGEMSLFSTRSKADVAPAGGLDSYLPAIVTVALAAAIFALDTFTESEVAASVLYVAVVLMSVRFCSARGTVLVTAACMTLTVISFLLTNRARSEYFGYVNTGIGLLTLGAATYLILKIEAVRHTAERLAETNLLRDALLGSVSHELRTPLTSIVGGISILADAPMLAKDVRLSSLANGVRDEAMRLNADIQNLLDAARITSKGLQTRQDWTDPADVVAAAISRVAGRFPGRRIEFLSDENLPLVYLDPVLVEQAIGQIIANALKFSPAGSDIEVSARVVDRQLVVSVTDKGAGLTADEKRHIAERFFRGERHIGKIPGSGLGLWIAETFISTSGGVLKASSPGENLGTTMQITFPNIRYIDEAEFARQDR